MLLLGFLYSSSPSLSDGECVGVGHNASSAFQVKGMHCAGCVATIERALRSVPGVVEAQVNLATEQATVAYVPTSVAASALRQAVTRAGYEPLELPADAELAPQHSVKVDELRALQRRFLVSLGL